MPKPVTATRKFGNTAPNPSFFSVKKALNEDSSDLVIVFGSFFTVSEAYEALSKHKQIEL